MFTRSVDVPAGMAGGAPGGAGRLAVPGGEGGAGLAEQTWDIWFLQWVQERMQWVQEWQKSQKVKKTARANSELLPPRVWGWAGWCASGRHKSGQGNFSAPIPPLPPHPAALLTGQPGRQR